MNFLQSTSILSQKKKQFKILTEKINTLRRNLNFSEQLKLIARFNNFTSDKFHFVSNKNKFILKKLEWIIISFDHHFFFLLEILLLIQKNPTKTSNELFHRFHIFFLLQIRNEISRNLFLILSEMTRSQNMQIIVSLSIRTNRQRF